MDLPFADLRFTSTAAGRWATMTAAFAAAVGARLLLDFVAPDQLPFITFVPAVLVVAFLCRPTQSGTLLVISALFGTYWTRPPSGETFDPTWIVAFATEGLLAIGLVELFKAANRKLRRQEELLELLNRELRHRLKNVSAMTLSIMSQAIRDSSDPDDIMETVRGRVNAIAAAHTRLFSQDSAGASIGQLIETVVAPLAPSPDRLKLRGTEVVLEERDATGFALVLHELATNALKYGGWSADGGSVAIVWHPLGRGVALEWTETASLKLERDGQEGFGSRLIRRAMPRAVVVHELRPGGLYCRIELPFVARAGSDAHVTERTPAAH